MAGFSKGNRAIRAAQRWFSIANHLKDFGKIILLAFRTGNPRERSGAVFRRPGKAARSLWHGAI